ncbi:MAG TPA: hypothetical protein VGG06_09255 [Thermoanaerobaculia bacterium]|jgi:hypothetical protein
MTSTKSIARALASAGCPDPHGKIVLVPDEEAHRRAGLAVSLDSGLAGLVGLWDDGEEFAAEVERVVANRTPPRPLHDVE